MINNSIQLIETAKKTKELESLILKIHYSPSMGLFSEDNRNKWIDIDKECLEMFTDGVLKEKFKQAFIDYSSDEIILKLISKKKSAKDFINFMLDQLTIQECSDLFLDKERYKGSGRVYTPSNDEIYNFLEGIYYYWQPIYSKKNLTLEYVDYVEHYCLLFKKLSEKAYVDGFDSLSDYTPLFDEMLKVENQKIKMFFTSLGLVINVGDIYYYGDEFHALTLDPKQALDVFEFIHPLELKIKMSNRMTEKVLINTDSSNQPYPFSLLSVEDFIDNDFDIFDIRTMDEIIAYYEKTPSKCSKAYLENKEFVDSILRSFDHSKSSFIVELGAKSPSEFIESNSEFKCIALDSDVLRLNYQDTVKLNLNKDMSYYAFFNKRHTLFVKSFFSDNNPRFYQLFDSNCCYVKDRSERKLRATLLEEELINLGVDLTND